MNTIRRLGAGQSRLEALRLQSPSLLPLQQHRQHIHRQYSSSTIPPSFSAGSDTPELQEELRRLLRYGGGWRLTLDGKGIERCIRFRSFQKAWNYMNAIANECMVERHHPTWSNSSTRVFIRWTTHEPSGLSAKDLKMAGICDDYALRLGQIRDTGTADGMEAKEWFN